MNLVQSEHLSTLIEYADHLKIYSLVADVFRNIVFTIYRGIYLLAKISRNVFESILGFLDFTTSAALNELFQTYKPLIWVVMVLSIMFVGYLLMFNKLQNKENVVTNLLILLVLMTLLPMAITQFNQFVMEYQTVAGETATENDVTTGTASTPSVVDRIFIDSIVDVEMLARAGFPSLESQEELNQLTVDNIDLLSINTKITDFSIHGALKVKRQNDQVLSMEQGVLTPNFLKEYYYRYSVSYWRGIFGLLTLAFVYLVYAIILARLIFELAINKVLALIISAADLHSGQRMKGAILEITKGYLTILGMIFMTVVFGVFVNWLYHTQTVIQSPLAMGILLIGTAFAMIDGAKIFERILGIDVGVRSGNRALLATLAGGSMLLGGAKSMVRGVGKAKQMIAGNPSPSSMNQAQSETDQAEELSSPISPEANYEDPINPTSPSTEGLTPTFETSSAIAENESMRIPSSPGTAPGSSQDFSPDPLYDDPLTATPKVQEPPHRPASNPGDTNRSNPKESYPYSPERQDYSGMDPIGEASRNHLAGESQNNQTNRPFGREDIIENRPWEWEQGGESNVHSSSEIYPKASHTDPLDTPTEEDNHV